MATLSKLYQDMEVKALKASRNLHKDFTRYLCGCMTFDEFIQLCREREQKFEEDMKRKG